MPSIVPPGRGPRLRGCDAGRIASRGSWRVDANVPAGLARVDALAGALDRYHCFHAARADLLRRMGARDEAASAYARALDLAGNASERAFLARRLAEHGG